MLFVDVMEGAVLECVGDGGKEVLVLAILKCSWWCGSHGEGGACEKDE